MNDFLELLAQQLGRRRDLGDARTRFESELSYGRYAGPPPFDSRAASVLILFYPEADSWYLPLTLRPDTLRPHGGQISLPGGLREPSEDSRQAALRELEEELGVEPEHVTTLGRLSDLYLFVSNYLVTPWVAVTETKPHWIPHAPEVADILEVPVKHLIDPSHVGQTRRTVREVTFRSPHIEFGSHQIWGATSMILGELIEILRGITKR